MTFFPMALIFSPPGCTPAFTARPSWPGALCRLALVTLSTTLWSPAGAQAPTTILITAPSADGASAAASTNLPAAGLTAALRTALELHPTIASQRAQTRAKAALVEGARAQRYPSLTLSSGGGLVGSGSSGRSAAAMVRQPLWTFGRITAAIDYAEQDQAAQAAALWAAQRQVVEDTAVAYAQVQAARERMELTRLHVERYTALQQQIVRRQAGGLAAEVDVRLAQTRLWQAQTQQESAHSDWRSAETALLALTQRPVPSELPVPAPLLEWKITDDSEEQRLARSASVRQREALVAVATADEARQQRTHLPSISLQGGRQYYSERQNGTTATTLQVVVEAQLDSLGAAQRAQVAAAMERAHAAREDLALARHDFSVRWRQLQDRRDSASRLIQGHSQSVLVLEESLASFQRQYESGYKSWLDVLNMARELFEQQSLRAQAQAEWRSHTLRMAAMTGLLDDTANLLPPPENR